METLVREIGYAPLPSQRRFHECRARYKLFSGAVGSGKSAALVQEALRLSLVNHGLLGLIAAPTYRVLHDTTERAFFEILNANKIPYVYNKSDKECLLTDLGSRIIFRTLDDPTRLVGTNLAWFGIDEAGYTTEAAFMRLQARLREPKAKQLCGMGATTPNGLNWVYDRFIGEKKTQDYEIIRAVPGENHYLPGDFYETLARSYDPRFYQQEVLGVYLSLSAGTVYHAFERSRNLSAAIEYRADAQLCWSLDFNYGMMCSVIGQIIDNAPNLYTSSAATKSLEVLDEIVIKEATIDLACSAFVDRTQRYRRSGQRLRVHVYGDHSGHSRQHSGATDYNLIKQYFSRQSDYELIHHVAAGTANPNVRDRVNAVNAALYNAHGETRLTIHPQCQTLVKDLERVSWAHDSYGNTLNDFDKRDKTLTHISDSCGYWVMDVLPLNRTGSGYKNTRLI